MSSIAESGVLSQLLLVYDPETGRAHIAEGNHRLGIARHLGIENVPVQLRVVEGAGGRGGAEVPIPLSVEETRELYGKIRLADLGIETVS